jgi:hypothetical protein
MPNARNVRNFYFLIYNGIAKNSEVLLLQLAFATEYTLIGIFTLLIFHNPVAKRARRRAKPAKPRRSRGNAACGGAPGAERAKLSLLNLSRDSQKFSIKPLPPFVIIHNHPPI